MSETTPFDIIYKVGVNIDPHCFECEREDCMGSCPYARDPDPTPHPRRHKVGTESARNAERYRQLRDSGVCMRCRKNPADKGVTCAACREKQKEYWTRRKERMKNGVRRVSEGGAEDAEPESERT